VRIHPINARSIFIVALLLSLLSIPIMGHATPMEWTPPDPVSKTVDAGVGPTDPLGGGDDDDFSQGRYYAGRILTGVAVICLVICHGGGALVTADPDLPGAPLGEAPEPATAALLATGLVALGWVRRRKRCSGIEGPRS
jgi:hypothetical protein